MPHMEKNLFIMYFKSDLLFWSHLTMSKKCMQTSFSPHMFKEWSTSSTNKSSSNLLDMKKYQLLISVKEGDK